MQIVIIVVRTVFSIHALLAESDAARITPAASRRFSIHALLAESDIGTLRTVSVKKTFLSTLSLRRATRVDFFWGYCIIFSIHALLAESDLTYPKGCRWQNISIHALLAESDS